MSSPSVEAPAGTRTLTFAQAVNEALSEEMRRDKTIVLMGEEFWNRIVDWDYLVEEGKVRRVLHAPVAVVA